MRKIFKKLYGYYHSISDMSMLLFTVGLEISAVLYILSFVICSIPLLGEVPLSVAHELSTSGMAIMIFSFVFAPITDAVIKCDIKE